MFSRSGSVQVCGSNPVTAMKRLLAAACCHSYFSTNCDYRFHLDAVPIPPLAFVIRPLPNLHSCHLLWQQPSCCFALPLTVFAGLICFGGAIAVVYFFCFMYIYFVFRFLKLCCNFCVQSYTSTFFFPAICRKFYLVEVGRTNPINFLVFLEILCVKSFLSFIINS